MGNLRIRIGVLSMCMLNMSALVITSAFGAIIAAFPGESVAKIQSLATIPSLGALITTLAAGPLAMHFSKKKLSLTGIALTALGGLMPLAWHDSIDILLGCGVVMGIGVGLLLTLAPMLIAALFEQSERAAVMGQSTAMNSLGLIVMLLVGSRLGAADWVNTYQVFLITVPIFLLVALFLPMDKPEQAQTDARDTGHAPNVRQVLGHLHHYVFLSAGLAFIMSFIYTIYPTNLSILVDMKSLGGTETTGLINAIGTAGGLAAGFGLRYINRLVRDKAVGVGFIALAGTFVCSVMGNSVSEMMLGAILSGIAMAMVMATIPYYISLLAHPWEMPVAMAAFQFMSSLGGILSPILLANLQVKAGSDAFYVGGLACLVVGGLCLLLGLGKRVLTQHLKTSEESGRTTMLSEEMR